VLSSPRLWLPRKISLGAVFLGFIALIVIFVPGAQAQSVPGFQAPEKPPTKTEAPLQVRAARGQAPLAKLYEHLKVDSPKIKRLPALASHEKQKELPGKVVRIGTVRPLPQPLDATADGTLYHVAEGDVRVMGVVSEGALYTRVQFTGMALPAGARVFVYSMKNGDEFYGPYEGQGPSQDGTFWTPPMKGDGVVIEYFVPKSAANLPGTHFKISQVAHVYTDPQAQEDAAGACNLEVTSDWATVARSVGRLDFVSGGGVGLCTGTLLSDTSFSQTPYVLTANHCFSTQSAAQSLRVYWNYNSGDSPPAGTSFTDGANLLATGTASDFTFVRLTGSLPGGLFFSGWNANPTPLSTSVTGIHHPDGSHKRISFGTTNSSCSGGLPGPCSNFTHVGWNSGTTEPGSSGSGIWRGSPSDAQLVGTLTGGAASCSFLAGIDHYGSFSVTYPSISSFLTGTNCVSALNPAGQVIPASGGTGNFSVTAPSGCNWTAASTASFITVTSGTSGSGQGTVGFSVAANNGSQRSGAVIVGGQVFSIVQAAGGSCAPTPISIGQTLNGTLSTSDCPLGDGSYYDAYSFDGTAGQQISIFMSASFDTYLFLLRPDGSTLAQNDDGGGGTNSRIPAGSGMLTLPTTGTYTIVANSFAANVTGPYTLTLNGTAPPAPTLQFGVPNFNVSEGGGSAAIIVTRTGSTSGAATVDYATSDTAGLNSCSTTNGIASSRCDYATTVGTLRFAAGEQTKTIYIPLVDDNFTEGNENFAIALSNPSGANLGSVNSIVVTINDNGNTPGHPLNSVAFFVRQHYIDFLGREPDPIGYQGWQDILNNCGTTVQPPCDRIEVSSAFFRSEEFQSRGYFIYRFYSAVGKIPGYNEFMPDFAKVSGFLSPEQLEANKVAFVNEFMTRPDYQNIYGALTDPTSYVNALLSTVELPNHPSRGAWITGLANQTLTRAQVLRQLTESVEVYQTYYNQAFVIMQYFGYLRRSADISYLQWIETMNQTGGDYRIMINGFLNSNEYSQRFGP
jgi:hypothetical protein